jgi:hypothetical protein
VPCLKVSMADFHEERCSRNGRALVIRNDLDFDRLMVEGGRRASHDTSSSRYNSLLSRSFVVLRSDTEGSSDEDVESDLDIMSLISPGLSSPDCSPRSSLSSETSASEARDIPSRMSSKTLVTEGSAVGAKVEGRDFDDADKDELADLTPGKVSRIKVRHEIPRIWQLEKPLPKMPVEIAPGILAV